MALPSRCVVQRLLPLTQYPDSSVRRGGVVGTLRNCCFEHRESWWGCCLMGGIGCSLGPLWTGLHSCFSPGHHEWLLGPEVDVLPFLLLPLAGPEDFSEEEMEREWLGSGLRVGLTGRGGRAGRGEAGGVQIRALLKPSSRELLSTDEPYPA